MAKAQKTEDTPVVFTPEALAGQLRDMMLKHVQDMRVIFKEMPEAEQRAYIGNCERGAVKIIEGCLEAVLTEGEATVVDVTANDIIEKAESIQIKVNAAKTKQVCQQFAGKAHQPMKLCFMPNREQVLATGETPKPDADQPTMFRSDDEVMRGDEEKPEPRRRRRQHAKLKLADS